MLSLIHESAKNSMANQDVVFAGDGVTLAGQIDYPATPPASGYPLLFILPNATYQTREAYTHYCEIGRECGYAVFRWDKRGTGRSGYVGSGNTVLDAVYAYRAALAQPNIDRTRAVIAAQGSGTALLGEEFAQFARVQRPHAVLLAGNMLNAQAITTIDARVQIIVGEHDWVPWQMYGKAACEAHNQTYTHGAAYYVAVFADRTLMDSRRDDPSFHGIARDVIVEWLKSVRRDGTALAQ
jgi:uncharacterized protein